MTDTDRFHLVEDLERAFNDCKHPYNFMNGEWCNVCGAVFLRGYWMKPHWRDIITKVVFKK